MSSGPISPKAMDPASPTLGVPGRSMSDKRTPTPNRHGFLQDSAGRSTATHDVLPDYSNHRDDLDKPEIVSLHALGSTRRYRINKKCLQTTRTPWLSDDEPLLSQILEQERLAWSSSEGSARGMQSNHTGLDLKVGIPCNDERSDGSEASPDARDGNHSTMLSSRRSYFVEGSMSHGSKATASTWQTPQTASSYVESEGSDDDADPTPRASIASETSSSFDLNEFKPLPATPSAVKQTIKRLGQKFKSDSTTQTDARKQPALPARKTRGGLRKSMSSWKMFSGSTSDVASDVSLHSDTDDDQSMKTTSTAKTFKSRTGLSRMEPETNHKSLLDDRKRKAEAAYAEQFGTVKKHKHRPTLASAPATESATQPATVRRKSNMHKPRVLPYKSPFRKAGRDDEDVSNPTISAPSPVQAPEVFASANLPPVPNIRTSSRYMTSGVTSDIDHLKRTSRTELEKENQQLRTMLRESQNQVQIRRSRSHSQSSSRSSSTRQIDMQPAKLASSNWKIHEDADASIHDNSYPITASKFSSTSPNKIMDDASDQQQLRKVQPVLPLPDPNVEHGVLGSTNAKTNYAANTGTVKYRGSAPRHSAVIELPRPLSMVLEGNENSDDGTRRKDIAGHDSRSPARKLETMHDGTQEYEYGHEHTDAHESNEVPIVRSRQTGDQQGQWQWPEDVF